MHEAEALRALQDGDKDEATVRAILALAAAVNHLASVHRDATKLKLDL